MLRKLLKYDLKAMFRFWWIAALACLGLSVLGGFCWMLDGLDRPVPEGLMVAAYLIGVMAFLSYTVMSILSTVLIFLRYYRNFFTDEGYLTFTLPVHRHTLLGSKIISGMILTIATSLVIGVGFFLTLSISNHEYFFSNAFWKDLTDFFVSGAEQMGIYFFLFLLEILVIGLLSSGVSLMLLYTCITFGSVIAKKGKVIASIGIYYGANSLISLILFLSMILCIPDIIYWMTDVTAQEGYPLVALMLLAIILLEALLCCLMYTLQHGMLQRKLNLS